MRFKGFLTLRKPVSTYRGVDWHAKQWRARIQTKGHRLTIGHYNTEQEAARAYDRAAVELYGTYARLNFLPKYL